MNGRLPGSDESAFDDFDLLLARQIAAPLSRILWQVHLRPIAWSLQPKCTEYTGTYTHSERERERSERSSNHKSDQEGEGTVLYAVAPAARVHRFVRIILRYVVYLAQPGHTGPRLAGTAQQMLSNNHCRGGIDTF
jgi:hypothetical protein